MTALRRWIVMICLCLAGASIYLLPYSTEVYYKPLQQALGVDNQEIGYLMSTLGVVNMLGYFPGGWLADRFSPRSLLTFSLIATGCIGLYFATFPPYWACFIVYAGWSVTSILTFWSALIKATRDWGGDEEQGRAFGILEGGRGLIRFGLSSLGVAVLGWIASETAGFSTVVTLYASLNIGLGIAVWFALRPEAHAPAPAPRAASVSLDPRSGGSAVLTVLKMPATWLIALVIFSAYTMYLGSFYFTPYATDAFGLGVVMAGYLGAGKMILRPFSATGAGLLGDRVGASRVVLGAFVVALLSFGVFALTPSQSSLLRNDAVRQPEKLVSSLAAPEEPVTRHLAGRLSEDLRAELDGLFGAPPEATVASVLGELNGVLTGELLTEAADFGAVELRPLTREVMTPAEGELSDETRARANRLLLEDAMPGVFVPIPTDLAKGGPPWFMLGLLLVNVALATLCLYALRGVYYAMLQEAGIPASLTGIACGVVSVLGYTPDIFLPPVVGYLLDRYPGGVGYRYVFGIVGLFCVLGIIASVAFVRRTEPAEAPAVSPHPDNVMPEG